MGVPETTYLFVYWKKKKKKKKKLNVIKNIKLEESYKYKL